MLAITSVAFAGAQSLAGSLHPPPTARQQMIAKTTDCMRKRMSADRVVSYNEAARTCRDQIRKQGERAVPNALVASGSPRSP